MMDVRDFSRVLVKLAGLLILVGAVVRLPAHLTVAMATDGPHPMPGFIAMTLGPTAISVAFGLVMYWAAGTIVDRVVLGSGMPAPGLPAPPSALEDIAISGLGVYFVISGLSDAAYYWGRAELYRAMMTPRLPIPPMSPAEFGGLLGAAVSVGLGFAVSLGGRRIVALRRQLLKTTDHVGSSEPGE
jgi:hypothetical protein